MADQITQFPRPRQLADLSPEAIQRRLANLIRHYVRTRSPAIAGSVVRHIEALCAHPTFEQSGDERCAYLRLKTHWRWLASTTPPASASAGS